MNKKYFVWSFDDGLEQDKKIINILKKYGMGATFNLNSGLYGDKTYIGRIGNYGIFEKPAKNFEAEKSHVLSYTPHFRIPEDEIREVYNGFEIASHTLTHKNLISCAADETRKEIVDDVRNLSEMFDQKIVGFAYPYGMKNKFSVAALQEAGIMYARTIKADKSFRFHDDTMNLPMTCWHLSANVFDTLEKFFVAEPADDDMLFLMFAHGYEFDFGTKESSWDKLRKICEAVSSHSDIICCSTAEALIAHNSNH